MAWARLDDRWHDHPKTVAAGLEAAGLWVMCLTWANSVRRTSPTPGVVPPAVLTRFAGGKGRTLALKLHKAGLFDDLTDDGWPIHDFTEYLPKYDAEQAREAGRKGGKTTQSQRGQASGTGSGVPSKPLSEPLDGWPSEPTDETEADW